MARPLLLIASRHAAVANALHQYVDLFFPNGEFHHRTEHLGFSSSAELFEKIKDYPSEQLRETMIVFDLAAEDGSSWEVSNMWFERGLAVQLVMSYPEIYFVFLYQTDSDHVALSISDAARNSSLEICWRHHFVKADRPHELIELVQHHARGFRVIFDATGLRSLIKQRLLNEVGGGESRIYEPLLRSRRSHAAAIIDEESAFVYLNGYVAYQAGFCSWLVGTWSEFRRLLMRELASVDSNHTSTRANGPGIFQAVISDWDLAFPDLPGESITPSLLLTENLFKRGEHLVLVTGFKNEAQAALLSTQDGCREEKPYGGMFKLLAVAPTEGNNPLKDRYEDAWAGILENDTNMGLREKIQAFFSSLQAKTRQRPANAQAGAAGELIDQIKLNRHSAPYARSAVANRLLARAKQFNESEELSTQDAIHMALLAGEAKEILGGMSRTTAYDALSTQNEAEVSAEVSFLGMSARVEVTQRLNKLRQEAKIVQHIQASGNLVQPERRSTLSESEEAHLNFLLQAVKKLRLRFSQHEQMEASEECLSAFSEYHYRLMRWTQSPLYFLRKLFELYLIKATKSGTSVLQLLMFCCGWIALFGVIYFVLLSFHLGFMRQSSELSRPWNCLAVGMWHSVFTFVELQPGLPEIDQLKLEQLHDQSYRSMGWMLGYRSVVLLELIVAYFHLGLLVSVLYRYITKRSP